MLPAGPEGGVGSPAQNQVQRLGARRRIALELAAQDSAATAELKSRLQLYEDSRPYREVTTQRR